MKRFECIYIKDTNTFKKSFFGQSEDSIKARLERKGFLVVSIKELAFISDFYGASLIEESEGMFWQLSHGLEAGMPLLLLLDSILENTYHRDVKALVLDIRSSIQKGNLISEALKRHPKVCSPFICAIYEVGEKSGNVSEVCKICAKEIKSKEELKNSFAKSLAYPVFMFIALFVAVIGISLYVVPEFVSIFESFEASLPLSTLALIYISEVVSSYYLYFLSFVLAMFWVLFYIKKRYVYLFSYLCFKIPLFGKAMFYYEMHRFSLVLFYFIKSAYPIDKALLTTISFCNNAYLKGRLSIVHDKLLLGQTLSAGFKATNLKIANISLIQNGEKTGNLDFALDFNAKYYRRMHYSLLGKMASSLGPVCTVIIGCLILFLALAVITPMWELVGSI
ncbi:type II secretion system F family protein [Helicobacter sp. 11S02629-2]|uniref:type II secretion system F family protein n=1 Tax=Helicobacter sp. 11S02629-2 TaxID=1476195 RepID=UPI000BA63EB3|nr:type II secretion system F family protein [Helicobacter sp. 11S02629-2]PAF45583.1 hypothetical protein BKH40_01505 [Helicobacter sp. 11S02629-2]